MFSSGMSSKVNQSEDVVSLSAPAGFHDVHEFPMSVQTHVSLNVCIAFVVTVCAVVIPIFLFYRRRWLNLLGQQERDSDQRSGRADGGT